jgi:hypothetical protein
MNLGPVEVHAQSDIIILRHRGAAWAIGREGATALVADLQAALKVGAEASKPAPKFELGDRVYLGHGNRRGHVDAGWRHCVVVAWSTHGETYMYSVRHPVTAVHWNCLERDLRLDVFDSRSNPTPQSPHYFQD